jgi:hypothetical protein
MGIVIVVRPTDPAQPEPLDLPNTRCEPVKGNRGIATRCLDTIARTTSTTFVIQGKTYTITTSGKGVDQTIYQHVVDSFAPAVASTRRPQIDLAPLLLQPGELPDTVVGAQADDPAPPNFEDSPPAARLIGLHLTRDGRAAGSMSVLLYDSPSDLARAYKRLTASVTGPAAALGNAVQPRTDVGDKAVTARLTLAASTNGPNHVAVIIFARCYAMIDIRLNDRADTTRDTALAYAKRLNQRVAALTCK